MFDDAINEVTHKSHSAPTAKNGLDELAAEDDALISLFGDPSKL
mgnify:CR=1 FL=1